MDRIIFGIVPKVNSHANILCIWHTLYLAYFPCYQLLISICCYYNMLPKRVVSKQYTYKLNIRQ